MTTTGMSTGEIDEVVARRQHEQMQGRRTRVTVVVVVLALLAFVLVPALSDPLRALRMQQRGTEAQAVVTTSDAGRPVTCGGSGCTEQVYVVFSIGGGIVPDSVLTSDISALSKDGADYALTAVEHAISSASATSKQGDRFPVWFVADGQGYPQDLTAQRPPSPLVSALTTWWWLLVLLLLLVLYPRIDAVARRRTNPPRLTNP